MPKPDAPTVLVTGAAQRIGRAIALDFAAQGWRVAIHCNRSRAAADVLQQEIMQAGSAAAVLTADLADVRSVEALVPQCVAALGAPHCLVNNASLFSYDDIATLDGAQWDLVQAINLRAPLLLSKALAAHLPAGVQGNIVNIVDQRVWKPTPHFVSYHTSKSGLWTVTQTLAQAFAPRIRVNAIGPGPVLKSDHQSEADFRAQWEAVPLGRGTTPEEIAAAIRFILAAPAMTGQMIALDGGQHLAWQTPDIGDGRG
jgi:NAD(P)-dependent dehydrogenase (short-subunit alcohol dehydrogenase family)